MVDSKPIVEHDHMYENLIVDIVAEGISVSEMLQTYALIEKLPASWSNYQSKMKHERRDFTLDELVNHLNIEEENRIMYMSVSFPDYTIMKANIVETILKDDNVTGDNNKNQKKANKNNNNNRFKNNGKIQKKGKRGECFVCWKTSHRAYQCYHYKGSINQN